jgi:hypothetical protein
VEDDLETTRVESRLKDIQITGSMQCGERIGQHNYENPVRLAPSAESECRSIVASESSGAAAGCLFDKLPVETLLYIFSFLPCHDALSTRRVCSLWDKLAREICLKKTILDDFFYNNEVRPNISLERS